jgi:hypothetical protein
METRLDVPPLTLTLSPKYEGEGTGAGGSAIVATYRPEEPA